ncbi:MAG TPA: hypothetical protein VMT18_12380 [Planctomycetota bacterium]|nr:hypothetical protein [Planctomycetota bacterium]
MFLSKHALGMPLGLALACALAAPADAADGVGVFVESTNFTALKNVGVPEKIQFHLGTSNSFDRPTDTLRMIPFAHDRDGLGGDTLGYYNQREGRFYFFDQNQHGTVDDTVDFGREGDFGPPADNYWYWPVVLNNPNIDPENDGVEVGVYDILNNTFHFQNKGSFAWGTGLCIPVVGDWNGNGKQSLGLYSLANQTFATNNTIPPSGYSQMIVYGDIKVLPIAGDWDDDGVDEVGYFDLRTQEFHRQGAGTITFAEPFFDNFTQYAFNSASETGGDPVWLDVEMLPVAGTWDSSGAPDPAPYGWTQANSEQHPFNLSNLDTLIQNIDNSQSGEPFGHVHSLVVAYNGRLVREAYFKGWDEGKAHHMMSATKSVLSALFGIAIKLGYVDDPNPGQPMKDLLNGTALRSEYLNTPPYDVCGDDTIDLLDVMTMTSGYYHHNNETGTPSNPTNFVTAGHFTSDDWIEWVLNGPDYSGCDGGWWDPLDVGKFRYYGGNNHIAAEFLRRRIVTASPYSNLWDFAVDKLCMATGITLMRWDHEPSSNVLPEQLGETVYFGESQMFMRPLDIARFGQVFLDLGMASGNQVMTPQWVEESTSDLIPNDNTKYGCWWWRQDYDGGETCYKGKKGYSARGYGGQLIWVYPELHVVIVITSEWRGLPNEGVGSSGWQVNQNEQIRDLVLSYMNGVTGSCN